MKVREALEDDRVGDEGRSRTREPGGRVAHDVLGADPGARAPETIPHGRSPHRRRHDVRTNDARQLRDVHNAIADDDEDQSGGVTRLGQRATEDQDGDEAAIAIPGTAITMSMTRIRFRRTCARSNR